MPDYLPRAVDPLRFYTHIKPTGQIIDLARYRFIEIHECPETFKVDKSRPIANGPNDIAMVVDSICFAFFPCP